MVPNIVCCSCVPLTGLVNAVAGVTPFSTRALNISFILPVGDANDFDGIKTGAIFGATGEAVNAGFFTYVPFPSINCGIFTGAGAGATGFTGGFHVFFGGAPSTDPDPDTGFGPVCPAPPY